MSVFLKQANRIFDGIVSAGAVAAGLILAFVVLLVSADICMRYFFNSPIQGSLETAEYGLLFLTLLAATWLVRRDKHVRMELLIQRLKPVTQAYVNACTSILCAVICAGICYYGVLVVIDRYNTGHRLNTTLEPISYPLTAIIPLCFFLLFVQFIIESVRFTGSARSLRDSGETN